MIKASLPCAISTLLSIDLISSCPLKVGTFAPSTCPPLQREQHRTLQPDPPLNRPRLVQIQAPGKVLLRSSPATTCPAFPSWLARTPLYCADAWDLKEP